MAHPSNYGGPEGMIFYLLPISFNLLTLLSSGKNTAIQIEFDCDFIVACDDILKRNKGTCQVNIEFDVDEIQGYRIVKCVSSFRLIQLCSCQIFVAIFAGGCQ